jgi:hypothetical protein
MFTIDVDGHRMDERLSAVRSAGGISAVEISASQGEQIT